MTFEYALIVAKLTKLSYHFAKGKNFVKWSSVSVSLQSVHVRYKVSHVVEGKKPEDLSFVTHFASPNNSAQPVFKNEV